MQLSGIDHVAFTCISVETTMKWYIDVLGFEHVFPGAWDDVPVFLKLGTTHLALFPLGGEFQTESQRPGFDHLAFNAATLSDFMLARDSLTSRGLASDFVDHELSHSIYFTDPDGRKLEITTYDVPSGSRDS